MKLPLTDKGSLKLVIFLFCLATVALIGFILIFQLGLKKMFHCSNVGNRLARIRVSIMDFYLVSFGNHGV